MSEPRPSLQTLDRGLTVLTLVSRAVDGITIADLAAALGVHRAICYRLVDTLTTHHLVARGTDGRVRLGVGIQVLADRFAPVLQAAARPVLQRLADEVRATAHLSMAEGADCVAVLVVEPAGSMMHVSYRVGSRHPLDRGAAGRAILAGRVVGGAGAGAGSVGAAGPMEAAGSRLDRRRGFSVTSGELQAGAVGVASAIPPTRGIEASVGVVALSDLDIDRAGAAVIRAVADIVAVLG